MFLRTRLFIIWKDWKFCWVIFIYSIFTYIYIIYITIYSETLNPWQTFQYPENFWMKVCCWRQERVLGLVFLTFSRESLIGWPRAVSKQAATKPVRPLPVEQWTTIVFPSIKLLELLSNEWNYVQLNEQGIQWIWGSLLCL